MNENNSDVRLALEEMRWSMQQSLSAGDALDQKVNLILVASGLVVALITTLQISLAPNRSDLYWFILFLAIGLYVLAVAVVLWGASPQAYRLAIASEWEQLDKHIFGRPERDVILSLLSGYVDQIQHNRRINHRKVMAFRLSLVVLMITVVLLVLLVAI